MTPNDRGRPGEGGPKVSATTPHTIPPRSAVGREARDRRKCPTPFCPIYTGPVATPTEVAAAIDVMPAGARSCDCGADREPGRGSCRACAVRASLHPACAVCGGIVPARRWRMCDPCATRGAAAGRRFWGVAA